MEVNFREREDKIRVDIAKECEYLVRVSIPTIVDLLNEICEKKDEILKRDIFSLHCAAQRLLEELE